MWGTRAGHSVSTALCLLIGQERSFILGHSLGPLTLNPLDPTDFPTNMQYFPRISPGACIHRNVREEKTHLSGPTWTFCIHFRSAEFTLSKKAHFTYKREISVFINSTFHLANVEFSGKFHVCTWTSEAHRPDLINGFYGYYCTYIYHFYII